MNPCVGSSKFAVESTFLSNQKWVPLFMIHFKARTLDWKIILRLLAGLKKRIPGKFTLTYFLGIGRKVFDTHSDNQLRHSYMYWKVFSHFYFFRDVFSLCNFSDIDGGDFPTLLQAVSPFRIIIKKTVLPSFEYMESIRSSTT